MRKAKEPLIERGMREIPAYLAHLERAGWEFDPAAAALAAELEPDIRKRLEREISGEETPDGVAKRVRALVRRELGIDSRAA